MARERYSPRDVQNMNREAIEASLVGWRFDEVGHADWRGTHRDGRQTCLKRSTKTHSATQLAQNDVLNGRIVCAKWPYCEHFVNGERAESIEACVVATRTTEHEHGAVDLKQGQRREFRGRREYVEQ